MSASLNAFFPHRLAHAELASVPERLAPLVDAVTAYAQEAFPWSEEARRQWPKEWEWGEGSLAAATASAGSFDEAPVLYGPGNMEIVFGERLCYAGDGLHWIVFLDGQDDGPRRVYRMLARVFGAREVLYVPDELGDDGARDYDALRASLLAEQGPPAPSLEIVRRIHDARQEAWREAERSCPSPVGTWWDHPDAVAAREERDWRYKLACRAIRARFGRGEYFVERVD